MSVGTSIMDTVISISVILVFFIIVYAGLTKQSFGDAFKKFVDLLKIEDEEEE